MSLKTCGVGYFQQPRSFLLRLKRLSATGCGLWQRRVICQKIKPSASGGSPCRRRARWQASSPASNSRQGDGAIRRCSKRLSRRSCRSAPLSAQARGRCRACGRSCWSPSRPGRPARCHPSPASLPRKNPRESWRSRRHRSGKGGRSRAYGGETVGGTRVRIQALRRRGMLTKNPTPWPFKPSPTCTCPPMRRTACCTMDRPRPEPLAACPTPR